MAKERDLQEASLVPVVAQAIMSGSNVFAISKQLNISRHAVRRIMEREEYKALVANVGEEAMVEARGAIRKNASKLTSEALRVLYQNLDDNDLEAAKTVFRILGLDKEEEKKNDTSIQIILPGQGDNAIEVENEVQDTEGTESIQ